MNVINSLSCSKRAQMTGQYHNYINVTKRTYRQGLSFQTYIKLDTLLHNIFWAQRAQF